MFNESANIEVAFWGAYAKSSCANLYIDQTGQWTEHKQSNISWMQLFDFYHEIRFWNAIQFFCHSYEWCHHYERWTRKIFKLADCLLTLLFIQWFNRMKNQSNKVDKYFDFQRYILTVVSFYYYKPIVSISNDVLMKGLIENSTNAKNNENIIVRVFTFESKDTFFSIYTINVHYLPIKYRTLYWIFFEKFILIFFFRRNHCSNIV